MADDRLAVVAKVNQSPRMTLQRARALASLGCARFGRSSLLSARPSGLERQAIRHVAAALLFSIALSVQGQDYRLPFNGRWFVMQGGDTPNVNHHMGVPAQWFGIDFAKVGGPGRRALTRATPSRVEDFYSWGEPVLSPTDGDVVAVVDALPDNPLGVKDRVLAPCGRCRELIAQINRKNLDSQVVLSRDRVVRLRDLLPEHWLDTSEGP